MAGRLPLRAPLWLFSPLRKNLEAPPPSPVGVSNSGGSRWTLKQGRPWQVGMEVGGGPCRPLEGSSAEACLGSPPAGRGKPEQGLYSYGSSSPLDGDGALDPLPTPQARQATRSRESDRMCRSPTTQSGGEGAQPRPQGTPNRSSSETQAHAAAFLPGHQLPPPATPGGLSL